ncbi:MAG: hypothetical protein JST90_18915 [Bacteroidetes bacterium]|nr:hypothetical protein [Bacteroidota bacterium]
MKTTYHNRYLIALSLLMIVIRGFLAAYYPIAIWVFAFSTFPVFGILTVRQQYILSSYMEDTYPSWYKSHQTFNRLVDGSVLAYTKDPSMLADQKLQAILTNLYRNQNYTGISFLLIVAFALLLFL